MKNVYILPTWFSVLIVFSNLHAHLCMAQELSHSKNLSVLVFPFNKDNRFSIDEDIIKDIEFLSENNKIERGEMNRFFASVKNKHLKATLAMKNRGALAESTDINVKRLISSFIICGNVGFIEDIEPFLEYALVYIGSMEQAFEIPPVRWSVSSSRDRNEITEEERLVFWPAAHAIIKNATISVPLLVDAAKDKNLDENLRLRAAGFLNHIAPELIEEEIKQKIEPLLVEKVNCIVKGQFDWKHVNTLVCLKLQKRKDRFDSLFIRNMRAAQMIKEKENMKQ